jgi:hypothetical protein
MTGKHNVRKALGRLLCSRRGTAEIIGSVMFLLIIMFFFTNVYLWHDRATREMDDVLSEKINSLVSIQVVSMNVTLSEIYNKPNMTLTVTNNGGVEAVLSRLWIITEDQYYQPYHNYADFEKGQEIRVAAGDTIELTLSGQTQLESDGSFTVAGYTISFAPKVGVKVTFTILTTQGNMAACSATPYK